MCYSAQIWSDYRKYVRELRAKVSITAFRDLFFKKAQGAQLLWPKGMEMVFANPQTEEEHEVWELVQQCRRNDAVVFEKGLFTQRKRLARRERERDSRCPEGELNASCTEAFGPMDDALGRGCLCDCRLRLWTGCGCQEWPTGKPRDRVG